MSKTKLVLLILGTAGLAFGAAYFGAVQGGITFTGAAQDKVSGGLKGLDSSLGGVLGALGLY